MKTIQLSSSIRPNTDASKVLGHPEQSYESGTYIDITDNLPRILRALKVQFDELEYFSYDLIKLRAKQLPENPHTVHLGKPVKVEVKNEGPLIHKAQVDPVAIDEVVGKLLKSLHPCRNCGDFIPLPKRFNREGGFYKRDAYCRACADIVIL